MASNLKSQSKLKSQLMGVLPFVVATLMLLNGVFSVLIGIFPPLVFYKREMFILKNEGLIGIFSHSEISVALSIILGLLLITVAIGLYRRLRSALYLSAFILLVVIAHNAYPVIRIIPLIFGIFSFIVLILFRKRFTTKRKPGQLSAAVATILFIIVIAYGSLGTFLMRDQFIGIYTFLDAIYYTLVTYSTVGYGDIIPQSADAKLFVITMILAGIGSFATIVTVLIKRHLTRILNMVETFRHYHEHTIICGVNHLTLQIAHDLKGQRCDVIFIDENTNQLMLAKQMGYDTLLGEAVNADTLREAHINEANFVICGYDGDAENILVTMVAKRLITESQSKAKIITKIDHSNNIENAVRSGADETIVPAILTSQKILTMLNGSVL